jgi:DNA-binding response OmpR family regulator
MARIVVVEEDPRVLGALVKILRSRGHEVVGTTDNEASIKAMRALSANLLIADIDTLGGKAVEIVRRVHGVFPNLLTILVSVSRGALLETSASLAVDDMAPVRTLKKPLRRAPLLDAVAHALAVQTAAEAKSRGSAARSIRTIRRRPRKAQRVLIVDSVATVRRNVRRTLETAGFVVDTAGDELEAMALFRKHRPDVAIVEIVSPGKHGETTIGEIRQIAPQTKIIAMSGADPSAPEANLSIAWMPGASRILRKPFRMADLLATVTEVLAEPSSTRLSAVAAPRRSRGAKHSPRPR